MMRKSLELQNPNITKFERLKAHLDEVCSEIAKKFDFYNRRGDVRKAAIINILSSSPCVGCIVKGLTESDRNRVDAAFSENHNFAVNILGEDLYTELTSRGFNVELLTEAKLNHSTADILMVIKRGHVFLRHNGKEVGIEVKTGISLSYPQLFRFFVDKPEGTLILIRIKNRSIDLLHGDRLREALTLFMEMVVRRGKRVLSAKNEEKCGCNHQRNKSLHIHPKDLEEVLADIGEGLNQVLPKLSEKIVEELGVRLIRGEPHVT